MTRALLALLVLGLVAWATTACDDGDSSSGDDTSTSMVDMAEDVDPPTPEELGEELFNNLPPELGIACAECHGPTGAGDGPLAPTYDPPPEDLRVSILTDEEMRMVISQGRNEMPENPQLTLEQLDYLIAFIRSLM